MSFIPITLLLNGVLGSGCLSHAINLYLCYKPPIEELSQFLEFQLPRQWSPVFSHLSLDPQLEQQNTFSFFGPELLVNTNLVNVGKRPVTGLRLYLEGKRGNRLAIHLQHLSSLPKTFQLEYSVTGFPGIFNSDSDDRQYYEKVQWKDFSHVCTAPMESEDDLSIVTGARLHIQDYGFKKVLFLLFCFSKVLNAVLTKTPQWDRSPGLESQTTEEVIINSAIYPGGPRDPVEAPELLEYVDLTEMTRGPQESPGYWVVSGARLVVDKGKISLVVKYSLLSVISSDDDDDDAT